MPYPPCLLSSGNCKFLDWDQIQRNIWSMYNICNQPLAYSVITDVSSKLPFSTMFGWDKTTFCFHWDFGSATGVSGDLERSLFKRVAVAVVVVDLNRCPLVSACVCLWPLVSACVRLCPAHCVTISSKSNLTQLTKLSFSLLISS